MWGGLEEYSVWYGYHIGGSHRKDIEEIICAVRLSWIMEVIERKLKK